MQNYERAFSGRPEVYEAWRQLISAIQASMDARRYELVTLAAARSLRSTYCCVAHGRVLQERFAEPVREIALDHRSAGLDEVDVAVMDLAERVVSDASSIGDCRPAAASRPRARRARDQGRDPGCVRTLLLLEDARRARRAGRRELSRARPGPARGTRRRSSDLGRVTRGAARSREHPAGTRTCEPASERYASFPQAHRSRLAARRTGERRTGCSRSHTRPERPRSSSG